MWLALNRREGGEGEGTLPSGLEGEKELRPINA